MRTLRAMFRRSRSLSDDDSWGKEIKKAAVKEKEIKKLIYNLSERRLSLRKVGVGVESKYVSKAEKSMSRKIVDYVVWNVKCGKLIAIADIVSTNYGGAKGKGKFFPVSLWKKEVMNVNVLPTALVYELELEPAEMKDRVWWFVGTDISGDVVEKMRTWHRGQVVYQDVVVSDVKLWTRGLECLIQRLLEL